MSGREPRAKAAARIVRPEEVPPLDVERDARGEWLARCLHARKA